MQAAEQPWAESCTPWTQDGAPIAAAGCCPEAGHAEVPGPLFSEFKLNREIDQPVEPGFDQDGSDLQLFGEPALCARVVE